MRSRALAVCLFALVLTAPVGAADATESSLTGHIRTTEDERLELSADVTGGLTGTLTLDLGDGGAALFGGAWRLSVRRQDGAGEWLDAGEVSGAVVRGTLFTSPDGQLVASDPIELEVLSGTGDFADVATGSGALSIVVTLSDDRPTTGRLSLAF